MHKSHQVLPWYETLDYGEVRVEVTTSGAKMARFLDSSGKTPDEFVTKTREMFVTVVATMIEDGQVPPPPASEGKRTEQVNVRLSVDEKLSLEASARRRGFAGLADYIRAAVIAAEK